MEAPEKSIPVSCLVIEGTYPQDIVSRLTNNSRKNQKQVNNVLFSFLDQTKFLDHLSTIDEEQEYLTVIMSYDGDQQLDFSHFAETVNDLKERAHNKIKFVVLASVRKGTKKMNEEQKDGLQENKKIAEMNSWNFVQIPKLGDIPLILDKVSLLVNQEVKNSIKYKMQKLQNALPKYYETKKKFYEKCVIKKEQPNQNLNNTDGGEP